MAAEPRHVKLRRHVEIVLAIAEEDEQPSRSISRAERLIAEIEQAAADLRAIARGR